MNCSLELTGQARRERYGLCSRHPLTPAPLAAPAALRGPRGVTQGTAQAAPRGRAEEAKFCRTTTGEKRLSLAKEDLGQSRNPYCPSNLG